MHEMAPEGSLWAEMRSLQGGARSRLSIGTGEQSAYRDHCVSEDPLSLAIGAIAA
jgi:hypothetical protein